MWTYVAERRACVSHEVILLQIQLQYGVFNRGEYKPNVFCICNATQATNYYLDSTRACFFCERVVNTWNNLPSNTDFSSLSAFKRFISNIDFSNYLKR